MLKRIFSMLLACLMVFSILPVFAAAEETNGSNEATAPNLQDVGDYMFTERESNNGIDYADVIYNDYTISGTTTVYDTDYYEFTLSRTSTVLITSVADNSGLVYMIYDLYKNVEATSESDGYSGGYYRDGLVATLSAGTYYICVLDMDNRSGGYMMYFSCTSSGSSTPTTPTNPSEPTTPPSGGNSFTESEPNDSKTTANAISHNDEVSGGLSFSSDSMDFYTFTLESAGEVTITLRSSSSKVGYRLDDASGFIGNGGESSYSGGEYVWSKTFTLTAGTYYISVVSSSTGSVSYTLELDAPTSGSSSVPGGSGFQFGKEYTKTWTSSNRNEVLYTTFTVPEDGYIDIIFSAFSTDKYDNLEFVLYNEDEDEIWSSNTQYELKKGKHSMRVGLAAGTYELATELNFVLMSGETYRATYVIDFTPAENYEITPCGSKATANLVELGTWYTGVNGEYPGGPEEYWKIVVEEDCRVLVYLPDYDDMTEDGYLDILDKTDDDVSEGPYVNDEGITFLVADLTAGTNYFKFKNFYGQVEYSLMVEKHVCEYELTVTDEPTCTYDGEGEEFCPICKDEREVEIPATGHQWGAWQTTKPATTTSEGTQKRTCAECDKTETQSIPKLSANPFTDVPDGKYYTQPILWALDQGITTGKTATTFEPNEPCTRGQIVTFLWRAMGEPEPASYANPFTDVKESAYYYKAVLWAYYAGITTGKTDTTFEPKAPCTRCQVVTFLWRTMGKPGTSQPNPFTDIPSGKYYTTAVLWALENGITTGKTATTFLPNDTCTRAQIVTFLYRCLVESGSSAPTPPATNQPTQGQKNALDQAYSYLRVIAFSYEGLVDQLEYEGYTHEEAIYAADNCGANWKEQALKCAKSYLNSMAFSYEGLVDQLEYEGFTTEEAIYGVDNCGADWYEQAALCAASYLRSMSFSRQGLIDQLIYEGFTESQAIYGVEQNGF